MDMCVHGECEMTKGLCHDHGGRFVANSRQCLQFLERLRYLARVLVHQDCGKVTNSRCLARGQTTGPYDGVDGFNRKLCHGAWFVGEFKESGRGLVYPNVRALGGKYYPDKQGIRIFVS